MSAQLREQSLAQGDIASLMMMRKQHHPWSNIIGGSSLGESGMPLPLTYPNNENFGVQAIRQVVDAVRTLGDSPAKLVEALAVARTNNLPDVVAVLEKKLGVAKDAASEGEVTDGGMA